MGKYVMVVLTLAAVLGGCAVTQPQHVPRSRWFEVDPVTGHGFFIYVPSTYRHDRPAPLIISCHGTPPFDVPSHHIDEWKWLGEKNGCIVVAPSLVATDGILGDGPIVGMVENERRILSIISALGYRYNIDRANIMITGFSGGGFPTYWVGLRNPELFSVVAARNCNFSKGNLHGWYPREATRTPVMVYYGQHDPGAIRSQSRQAIEYLASQGFAVKVEELPGIGHERHPEVAVEFFRKNWRPSRPSVAAMPTN